MVCFLFALSLVFCYVGFCLVMIIGQQVYPPNGRLFPVIGADFSTFATIIGRAVRLRYDGPGDRLIKHFFLRAERPALQ